MEKKQNNKFFTIGFCNKKSRGQAAIEFIFIILIVIIYVFTTSKPFIENAQGTIEDIQNITQINQETKRLNDAITKISLLGINSQNTLTLIIPKNAELFCLNDKLRFETKINQTGNNPKTGTCQNNVCDKNFEIRNDITLNCDIQSINTGIHNIKIKKTDPDKVIVSLES
jgi:hypothetical protein